MSTLFILCMLLLPASMEFVVPVQEVRVTCKSERADQLQKFYAEITLPATAADCAYRLQVATEGPNGRSRQSQSGTVAAGEAMPVRVGSIRVKLADDAAYECICTVLSDGVVLASDTLRSN